jgi:hypothetical protein
MMVVVMDHFPMVIVIAVGALIANVAMMKRLDLMATTMDFLLMLAIEMIVPTGCDDFNGVDEDSDGDNAVEMMVVFGIALRMIIIFVMLAIQGMIVVALRS